MQSTSTSVFFPSASRFPLRIVWFIPGCFVAKALEKSRWHFEGKNHKELKQFAGSFHIVYGRFILCLS